MNTDRLRPGVFENTDRLVNFVLLDVVDALKAGLELDPDCPAVANYFQIRTGTAPEGFDIFQIILADGTMLAISTEKTLAKTGVKNSDTA